jgi:hypothetical protein
MANINAPRGLVPVKYLDGSAWNGAANMYFIPSTDPNAMSPGDMVISAAVSDGNGVMGITKALGTSTIRGVIVGFFQSNPYNTSLLAPSLDLTLQNIPATKTKSYYAMVVDDPNVMFEVMDDGLSILTATAVNKNASMTVANPTPPGQNSATVLTTASVAVTQALNFRIMGLVQRDDNTFGQFARWLVKPNQHELMGNTAGI